MKSQCSLSDVYFIFADNIYQHTMSMIEFKAIVNFYALFYDRIIIPDTFFINNQHLLHLFSSAEGLDYLRNKIIVPTMRHDVTNLIDLYKNFEASGTLSENHIHRAKVLNILDQIPLEKSIKWNSKEIGENFTVNILSNIDNLTINDELRKIWIDKVSEMAMKKNTLTRQLLHDTTNKIDAIDTETKKTLLKYVDISYNFNIPNFFHSSAAFPELFNSSVDQRVTPSQVFFNQSALQQQNDLLANYIKTSTTIFNVGILASLQPDQITYIRQKNEHKNLIKHLRNIEKYAYKPEELQNSIFDFIYMYDQELPQIVTREIKEQVRKEKRILQIQTFFKGATNDGADIGMNFVGLALDGVEQMIGSKLIGQLVNIVTAPMAKKTQRKINQLNFKGRCKIEELKSEHDIYDTIRSFSLNSIKK